MSKKIPLTQGQFAIVDDEDYEWLNRCKWYAWWNKCTQSFYAVRKSRRKNGKEATIYMAREILGQTWGGKNHTDHANHITLDNQRSNIRICTASQNHQNSKKQRGGTSKYKGVRWHKMARKWHVEINPYKSKVYLGLFTDEIEAAKAYDAKAIELFGEFAKTNF